MSSFKYGNNTLIEFSAMMDTDLAVVCVCKTYSNAKYMHSHIINSNNFYDIRCMLKVREHKNPLSILFKPEYHNSIDTIYDEILAKHYPDILKLSIPTNIFTIAINFVKTNGLIDVTVLCKNQQEEQYIRSLNDKFGVIVEDNYSKVNIKKFDCIFLKYYENILLFKEVAAKNIMISDYRFNLEKIGDEWLPKMSVSIDVGDINKLYTISSDKDLVIPKDIKEIK